LFNLADDLHNADHLCFSESHHVLQVNEGVVDGGDLNSLLQAGPEDQAANAAKSTQTESRGYKDIS